MRKIRKQDRCKGCGRIKPRGDVDRYRHGLRCRTVLTEAEIATAVARFERARIQWQTMLDGAKRAFRPPREA